MHHLRELLHLPTRAGAAPTQLWVRFVVLLASATVIYQAGCSGKSADPGSGGMRSGAGAGGTTQGGSGAGDPVGGGGLGGGTSGGGAGGTVATGGSAGTTSGESGAPAAGGSGGAISEEGGAPSAGGTDGATSGQGGAGGSTGGAGGDDGTEVLGDPCATPAALACAGFHQRVTLICGADRRWTVNQTCQDDQVCDTSPGLNRGICRDRLPECRDFEPGHRFCQGDTTLVACGPDNVTLETVETCTGVCWDNACDNRPNHCPSPAMLLTNCADDCGGRTEGCMANCPGLGLGVGPSSLRVEFTVRTPAYDAACSEPCNPTRRGVPIYQDVPISSFPPLRASITPPWHIAVITSAIDRCDLPPENCVFDGSYDEDNFLYVYTDDVTAGPANISFVTGGETSELYCPE
jgi:hypothetical protein